MSGASSAPVQAEDPFADLADALPQPASSTPLSSATGQDDGQGYVWKVGGTQNQDDNPLAMMATDQPNVAPAPPTKIKILKRRNTTDRKADGSATIVTPTTEDLESRAKEKELEYQRARERILGNDADALLNNAATPPQRSTTNSPSGGGGVSSGSVTPSNSSHPGLGGESFTSTTSSNADVNPASTSIHSNRGKQRSPAATPNPNLQEDMSEYRRMPVAYVPTANPNAPTYAAIPYTPPNTLGNMPTVYPSPHPASHHPALAWDPSNRPPIGYIHLPGLPAYPIPPPPPADQLRAMGLPAPRTAPPFPIYPPLPNAMPPFVLFPFNAAAGTPVAQSTLSGSSAASLNASRTGSPASAAAAGAKASSTRTATASVAGHTGGVQTVVVGSEATAGTAAGLLERQMAGMQLSGGGGPGQQQQPPVYSVPSPRAYNGTGGNVGMGRGTPLLSGQPQPPPQQQQQQQQMGGAEVRRSRSGASNRGRGRLWKPSS